MIGKYRNMYVYFFIISLTERIIAPLTSLRCLYTDKDSSPTPSTKGLEKTPVEVVTLTGSLLTIENVWCCVRVDFGNVNECFWSVYTNRHRDRGR